MGVGRRRGAGPYQAFHAAADVQGHLAADRPVAGTARASMTGSWGQMRQTTTPEVRLDHGEATGSDITQAGDPTGWLRTEAVVIEFRCGETSRDGRSGSTSWESGECRITRYVARPAPWYCSRRRFGRDVGADCILVIEPSCPSCRNCGCHPNRPPPHSCKEHAPCGTRVARPRGECRPKLRRATHCEFHPIGRSALLTGSPIYPRQSTRHKTASNIRVRHQRNQRNAGSTSRENQE